MPEPSFDNGVIQVDPSQVELVPPSSPEDILKIFQNPGAIRKQFNLDDEQIENVQAIVTGAAAGASVKYLSRAVGPELAGLLGGLLGGILSKRLLGK